VDRYVCSLLFRFLTNNSLALLVTFAPPPRLTAYIYMDYLNYGKHCFNGRSLHLVGDCPNPYEQAISIIGKTLSPFDEDTWIPCFGFGDSKH
jgi:hypothetical protein